VVISSREIHSPWNNLNLTSNFVYGAGHENILLLLSFESGSMSDFNFLAASAVGGLFFRTVHERATMDPPIPWNILLLRFSQTLSFTL